MIEKALFSLQIYQLLLQASSTLPTQANFLFPLYVRKCKTGVSLSSLYISCTLKATCKSARGEPLNYTSKTRFPVHVTPEKTLPTTLCTVQ